MKAFFRMLPSTLDQSTAAYLKMSLKVLDSGKQFKLTSLWSHEGPQSSGRKRVN